MLVRQLLEMRFMMATLLNETVHKIDNLITHISNMGDLDWPTFKTYVLINTLGGEFEYMQLQIHASSNDPGFSAKTVVARILQKSNLIKQCAEGGEGPSALISSTNRRERPPLICTHCKCTGHIADFCISCGGKFAGHTLEEARIAQRVALVNNRTQSQNPPSSANITTREIKEVSRPSSPALSTTTSATTSTTTSNTVMINGVAYSPIPSADSANIAMIPIIDPKFPFTTYHAEESPYHTSIDWNKFSRPMDVHCDKNLPSAYSASQLDGQQPHDSPFILNSGESCHISPEKDDFVMLHPTVPHPITGFRGSCIYATGISTIKIRAKSGKQITLNHVLFIPNSTVRLISVFSLNNDRQRACYFDSKSCFIIDSSGYIVISGQAWVSRRLYTLDCTSQKSVLTPNTCANVAGSTPPAILYATRTPDLEMWHRRLGHCSNQTIIDMARHGIVEGMPIDLSYAPATCDHCILGKQTRSHVPRMCEGRQATKRLERVFIDLCGPMPYVSKYGHLYSMNVINDFSSYVWSLPLKSKNEAMNVLRAWHCAVENQTGEKLKIIITNNGELTSKTTSTWCVLYGIEHQTTAPYTSAQNGRVE